MRERRTEEKRREGLGRNPRDEDEKQLDDELRAATSESSQTEESKPKGKWRLHHGEAESSFKRVTGTQARLRSVERPKA